MTCRAKHDTKHHICIPGSFYYMWWLTFAYDKNNCRPHVIKNGPTAYDCVCRILGIFGILGLLGIFGILRFLEILDVRGFHGIRGILGILRILEILDILGILGILAILGGAVIFEFRKP